MRTVTALLITCLHGRTYRDSLEDESVHGMECRPPSLQALSGLMVAHQVNERKGEGINVLGLLQRIAIDINR